MGGSFVNKGAEAMMRTVEKHLQKHFTPLTLCFDKQLIIGDKLSSFEAPGFEILSRSAQYTIPYQVLLSRLARQPQHPLTIWRQRHTISQWYHLVRRIDAVIDISGYAYADGRNLDIASYAAQLVAEMHRQGKPYILMPQSWGPFEQDKRMRELVQQLCSHASLVYARDIKSRQYLAELLKRPVDDIDFAPDITFAFDHCGSRVGWQRLVDLGVKPETKPLVCIAPNMRVYERANGFGSENQYVKTLAGVARQLLEKGATVILLPHEVQPKLSRADDRTLCDLIRLMVPEPTRVVTLLGEYPTDELKAMVSCCDLLIGSRFHAIMAAVHSRVPVVAIGWTHKYQELMQSVGLDSFVLNYDEDSSAQLTEMVIRALAQCAANRAILEQTIPPLEADAVAVLERAVSVINRMP